VTVAVTPPLANRLRDERPVHVAYSTHRRFEECPFQEALLRSGIDRSPKPRRNFLVGNVVHGLMEYVARYYQLPSTEWLVDAFNAEADRVRPNEWRSPTDRRELWSRTAAQASAFGPWLVKLLRSVQRDIVAMVAEPYYWWKFPTPAGNTFHMESRPDLVITTTDDRILIFDWKTGNSKRDPLQLGWYEAVTSVHPEYGSPPNVRRRRVESRFVWVGTDGKVHASSPRATRGQRKLALARAAEVADLLYSGPFAANPERWRCTDCRVSASCTASRASGDQVHALPTRNPVRTGRGSVPSTSGS